MGGSAAVAYAGAHPERVAALMPVGTPGKAPQEMARKVMDSLGADHDKTMTGCWDCLLNDARRAVRRGREAEPPHRPRDASMAMIEASLAYDPLPALAAYAVSGTSHWPQLDDPPAFARLLDEFLTRVQ